MQFLTSLQGHKISQVKLGFSHTWFRLLLHVQHEFVWFRIILPMQPRDYQVQLIVADSGSYLFWWVVLKSVFFLSWLQPLWVWRCIHSCSTQTEGPFALTSGTPQARKSLEGFVMATTFKVSALVGLQSTREGSRQTGASSCV